MTNYTDEELDDLIAFGEPYNREGDVAVLNALTQLKEARAKIQQLEHKLRLSHTLNDFNNALIKEAIEVIVFYANAEFITDGSKARNFIKKVEGEV